MRSLGSWSDTQATSSATSPAIPHLAASVNSTFAGLADEVVAKRDLMRQSGWTPDQLRTLLGPVASQTHTYANGLRFTVLNLAYALHRDPRCLRTPVQALAWFTLCYDFDDSGVPQPTDYYLRHSPGLLARDALSVAPLLAMVWRFDDLVGPDLGSIACGMGLSPEALLTDSTKEARCETVRVLAALRGEPVAI